ncbi:hypothetical protein GCM10008932_08610 [Alkalibacterium iburiense]|uniref:GH16 domain-containing protein n=1 Tax=Alkalibacterium iburiense TaxID=290589 RepID=A0ABN0X8U9_9LACT
MKNKKLMTIVSSALLLTPLGLQQLSIPPVMAQEVGMEENRLSNGDFSDGTTNWSTWDGEGGASEFTVDADGVANVHIQSIAGLHEDWGIPISWSTQLFQEGVRVDSGYTYELSFDASSTQPRPIEVEFTGLSGVNNVPFELEEEMTTFTHVFDYSLQSNTIDLKFLFGYVILGENETQNEAHTISIDNVSLRAVSEIAEGEERERDWSLVWEDEFDGDSLDLSKWRYDIGNYMPSGDEWVAGWGNEESQYYQEDNVRVEDGRLIIEAREETVSDEHGTYDYTSGKILTDGRFSQRYGRFEASMKLPEGQGFWPAFWMMPQDDVYGGWAASGEIDIMENRGDHPDTVGAAIHYGGEWPGNTHSAGEYRFPEGRDITDFNLYSIEWEPGEIRWYVNDDLYYRTSEWHSDNGEYPAPFDQEFYLILNLAVGGWYGLEPDESTPLPSQVEVDYVRVYEDQGLEEAPVPTPDPVPDPNPEEPTEAEDPFNRDDWRVIGDNLIQDGTFEQTTTFGPEDEQAVWSIHNQGLYEEWAGLASFNVLDDVLNVTVEQMGWEWWHIQLFQEVTLPSGFYLLSFDMASEIPRDIYVELTNTGIGLAEFSINEDMNTFETIFELTEDSESQLLFGFGRNPDDEEIQIIYNMMVDNIILVEVERIEDEEPISEEPADPEEPVEEDTEDPDEEEPPVEDETDGAETDESVLENPEGDSDGDAREETKDEDVTGVTEDKNDPDESGEALPKTATSTWTIGALGAIGLASGGGLKWIRKRRK